MGVTQKKVAVQDLEIGMFVSDLDRPWHVTPFPIQGFYIRSQDEIRSLVSHCRWVIVDVAETRADRPYEKSPQEIQGSGSRRKSEETVQLPPLHVRNAVVYDIQTTLKKELKASARLLEDAETALDHVVSSVAAGKVPELTTLADVARNMTRSVVRQPNALLWLMRVREHDDYTYRHSLNTSVWALVCGRHLGLQEGLLDNLAMGCLLAHVGKAELPRALLDNEHRLDADQFREFKQYVELGAAKLEESGLSRAVVSVVYGHRERHNGSGFPQGIRGDRIPLLAKIAGLVDYYETLIEPRAGNTPMTPYQAVSRLYETRDIEFQGDLVEKFIQAVGIYPTGTLVELSDGQRGIVVSHSPRRRLWPRIMVMTDQQHQPLRHARVLNLAEYNEGRGADEALSINHCLPHGTGGLNPTAFDVTGAETSRWSLRKLVGG